MGFPINTFQNIVLSIEKGSGMFYFLRLKFTCSKMHKF